MEAPIPQPSAALRSFFESRPGQSALDVFASYFHATLEGTHHIPREGGALIVSNHALFAIDTLVLGSLLVRETGRHPRFLADRMLWKIPVFRQVIAAIGALPGHPDSAHVLLQRGELVVVYPGGVDDSLKLDHQRYELQWKQRAGFARVALRAQVPVVPVVGLGIDHMYSVLGRERFIGRRVFGSPRYDLPFAFGAYGTLLPRRVPHRYVVLPPIAPEGSAEVAGDVERLRKRTFDALDAWLAEERKKR